MRWQSSHRTNYNQVTNCNPGNINHFNIEWNSFTLQFHSERLQDSVRLETMSIKWFKGGGDWLSFGEPRALQQGKDMTQVQAPWSKIVLWMSFPPTKIWNWNARWCESLFLKYSKLNVIRFDSNGSTAPIADNGVLCWLGHFYRTSSTNISQRTCNKFQLYYWFGQWRYLD